MRIVAGKHRGRPIAVPQGRDVRPTGERVREALFNMLAHGGYDPDGGNILGDAAVLDVFAGSGALGLEALSRGAASCRFFEKDRRARFVIEENLKTLGETEAGRALQADALRPPPAEGAVNLVFLDPPYGRDLVAPALQALTDKGWIGPETLVCVELDGRDDFTTPDGWTVLQDRHYGRTRIVLLRMAG
jgi:16S rRNA (guanine966-N2)-methyltransferase